MNKRFGGVGNIGKRHNSRGKSTPTVKRTKLKKGDSIKKTSTGKWIEQSLANNLKHVQSSKPGVIRCSGIGDGARTLALKYSGEFKETVQLPNLRYMNNGTYGHERWEQHLKDAGIMHASESAIPPHPDLPLQGQFDFIVKDDAGEKFLLELKTTNSQKWNNISEPDMMHISQWAIYSDRLKVEKGFIIYENRDNLTPKYFPISREGTDISLYTLSGIRTKVLNGFVTNTYDKVRFAIWCVENDAFPAEECDPCKQWGCKMPDLCKEYQETKQKVAFEELKRQ